MAPKKKGVQSGTKSRKRKKNESVEEKCEDGVALKKQRIMATTTVKLLIEHWYVFTFYDLTLNFNVDFLRCRL